MLVAKKKRGITGIKTKPAKGEEYERTTRRKVTDLS